MAREVSGGLMPGARMAKEDVNYRAHEKCGTCVHFYTDHCDLVDGNISADNLCDRWEISTGKKFRDKEFFLSEFNKNSSKKPIIGKQGKGKEFYDDAYTKANPQVSINVEVNNK